MPSKKNESDNDRLDQIVTESRHNREKRDKDYRERALKMYPWICARCGREFIRENLHELTIHHRDHNHDNNPPDGSNWELLCLYCHDNEHSRQLDAARHGTVTHGDEPSHSLTYKPFADLKVLLKDKK